MFVALYSISSVPGNQIQVQWPVNVGRMRNVTNNVPHIEYNIDKKVIILKYCTQCLFPFLYSCCKSLYAFLKVWVKHYNPFLKAAPSLYKWNNYLIVQHEVGLIVSCHDIILLSRVCVHQFGIISVLSVILNDNRP